MLQVIKAILTKKQLNLVPGVKNASSVTELHEILIQVVIKTSVTFCLAGQLIMS